MTDLAAPTDLLAAQAGTAPVPLTTQIGHFLRSHPWLTWGLTRAVGVAVACTALVSGWSLGTDGMAGDVLATYRHAHAQLVAGHVPYRDFLFEYPPGSLPFMYLPGPEQVSRLAFLLTYVSQMLVLDAVVHRMLRRAGGRAASAAADLWLFGGALTLGLMLCRNDMPACLAVVAGLLALRSGRSVRAGVLLAAGALVKVWPAELLLLVVGYGRRWIRATAAAIVAMTVAVVPFVAFGALPGMLRDLVGYHGSRGVEIEAVAALPQVLFSAVTGRAMNLSIDHDSVNLAHSGLLADVSTAANLLVAICALGWVVVRRRQGCVPYPRLALFACWLVGANLLVAKVFSPQYMLWLLAVAAVGVHAGVIDRVDQRLVLGAMLATSLEYSFDFSALGLGGTPAIVPAIILLIRDGLLLYLVARWTVVLVGRDLAGT